MAAPAPNAAPGALQLMDQNLPNPPDPLPMALRKMEPPDNTRQFTQGAAPTRNSYVLGSNRAEQKDFMSEFLTHRPTHNQRSLLEMYERCPKSGKLKMRHQFVLKLQQKRTIYRQVGNVKKRNARHAIALPEEAELRMMQDLRHAADAAAAAAAAGAAAGAAAAAGAPGAAIAVPNVVPGAAPPRPSPPVPSINAVPLSQLTNDQKENIIVLNMHHMTLQAEGFYTYDDNDDWVGVTRAMRFFESKLATAAVEFGNATDPASQRAAQVGAAEAILNHPQHQVKIFNKSDRTLSDVPPTDLTTLQTASVQRYTPGNPFNWTLTKVAALIKARGGSTQHVGVSRKSSEDDMVRNSDAFEATLLAKQVPPDNPLSASLGCRHLPRHEAYERLYGVVGTTVSGDLVRYEARSNRVAAMANNSGDLYVPPPDEIFEDEDGLLCADTHASHGCHDDRCSCPDHVWWESYKKNRWRHFCSVFKYAPCLHAGICSGRSCIKPKVAMPMEAIDHLKALLDANIPP